MVMRNSFYKVELYVSKDMKVISENLQVYPICLIGMISKIKQCPAFFECRIQPFAFASVCAH